MLDWLAALDEGGVRQLEGDLKTNELSPSCVFVFSISLSLSFSLLCRAAEITTGGKTFQLLPNMVTIKRFQKTLHGEHN